MNSVVTQKENAIFLTLPNVTLGPSENENEESGENGNTGTIEGKGKQFKGECESVADAADEEEFFCQQHFTNKDRLSPELQDVYKLLMQLPSFSHASWNGFNGIGQKNPTFSPANIRKGGTLGKTRKNAFTTGKGGKNQQNVVPVHEKDSLASKENKPESQTKLPSREVVKMHSINLYQSILPSSLFARNKVFK